MNLTIEVWEKAYLDFAPKILGLCRRYVSDLEIAEDLMHESFLLAMRKSDTYSGRGTIEAWLRRIAVNNALMYLRQNRKKSAFREQLCIENIVQPNDEPDPEGLRAVIEQAEFTQTELLEVIDDLPDHHRIVFNMYVLDHYSHQQIGRELNISPGTSKSHLSRARKRIQILLYQKAVRHSQPVKKRKRAALLIFLPYRTCFIDQLYRQEMLDFSMKVCKRPDSFSEQMCDVKLPETTYGATGGSFFGIYWITGLSIVALTLAVLFYHKFPSQQADFVSHPTEQDSIQDTAKAVNRNRKIDMLSTENQDIANRKTLQPIIVKKQIIQHKSIIIRDTILIIDTTHVH